MGVNKYICVMIFGVMCTHTMAGKVGKRLKELEDEVKNLKEATKKTAAFTACSSNHRDYNNGDTVVFDKIIYDEGGYYDTNTNMFTCPVAGMYFFYSNILSREDSKMHGIIDVVGNDNSVMMHAIGNWNSGSNLVFTICEKNQKVRVISMFDDNKASGIQSYGDVEGCPVTFSGVLLKGF